MTTTTTTLKQGLPPFSPKRTQQMPGGSDILDQNLDLIKKHFDALAPLVSVIARTLNINLIGSTGTGGSSGTLSPGGVVFVNGTGGLASDPAKLAWNDTTGVLTIARLAPGGVVQATALGALVTFSAGANRVPFGSGASGQLTDSATFVLSGGNLGVGLASPTGVIHARAAATPAGGLLIVENTASGTGDYAELGIANNLGAGARSSLYMTSSAYLGAGGASAFIVQNAAGPIAFQGQGSASIGMTITKNGAGVPGDIQVARLNGGGIVKAAVTTGQLAIASSADVAGAITWPAATDVLVSSGTGTAPVGDANFTYDTTAHTLTLLGSAPIALGTGTQTVTKASGTLAFTTTGAGAFTFSPNSTLTLSLTTAGQVRVNSLTAGGMVSASVGSGQLGIAVAGTDYQAPVVWPTASQVLISAGVAVDPLGDSTFTFDRVAHVMAGGDAIGINGVAVPTNAHLVTGSSNNTNRDRIQFFVGGGALGSTGTGDNTLLDVNPIATTIRVGVTAGIYATQRIRGITYAGGGTSITEAATLYIDDAPTLGGGISSPSPYALHVAAGQTKLGGTLFLPLLVAGGALAVDTTGLVGLAGVGGMTPAICGEQHYYINATGASLATGANNWLVTSQITGVGNVRTDNVHAFAAAKASLSIRLLNNSMATGSLAVQIMRNGGTFATISILPASVAPSTISIVPTTVGSPAAADTWGVLVNGTATFGAGNMIFTVDLMLSPNVF